MPSNKMPAVAAILFVSIICGVVWDWMVWARERIGPPQHELPATRDAFAGLAWLHGRQFANYFDGHTESAFVEKYGIPNLRWYWDSSDDLENKYPGAVTLSYKSRSGTISLSFCQQLGKMVCFRSEWLPEWNVDGSYWQGPSR
jgi:hypothetical protein